MSDDFWGPFGRCKARVHNTGGWGMRNCQNKATSSDGYCGIHSPEAVQRRSEAQSAKYRAKLQASRDRRREGRRKTVRAFLAWVQLQHPDAEHFTPERLTKLVQVWPGADADFWEGS